jgi:hypothetical protein
METRRRIEARRHAAGRLWERYGVQLSDEIELDHAARVLAGETLLAGAHLGPPWDNQRERHRIVDDEGRPFIIAWSPGMRCIVSYLPLTDSRAQHAIRQRRPGSRIKPERSLKTGASKERKYRHWRGT